MKDMSNQQHMLKMEGQLDLVLKQLFDKKKYRILSKDVIKTK